VLTNLASPTRILSLDALDGDGLGRAAFYLTSGAPPRIVLVRDGRPFLALEPALAFLAGRFPALILDRIVPNPRSEDIGAMAEAARDFKPTLVIGVGGGSALDSAKAVSLLQANPGDLDDYLGPNAPRKPEKKGPPLLLIPTTTGTGSEVTRFGVYMSRAGRKYTLASPCLQATAALLVATAVADIPPALLAATAYDAVTHALETLWNRNATALSDELATEALVALLDNTRSAFDARAEGRRDASVTRLLAAACAAGVAFNLTGTAAIHALSFILSEEWHLPHGVACAFFTDAIYSANAALPLVAKKLAAVARTLEPSAPTDDAVDSARLGRRLVELRAHLGLPARFADLDVGAADLPPARVAALFDKVQEDSKLANNAAALDAKAVRKLVQEKLA